MHRANGSKGPCRNETSIGQAMDLACASVASRTWLSSPKMDEKETHAGNGIPFLFRSILKEFVFERSKTDARFRGRRLKPSIVRFRTAEQTPRGTRKEGTRDEMSRSFPLEKESLFDLFHGERGSKASVASNGTLRDHASDPRFERNDARQGVACEEPGASVRCVIVGSELSTRSRRTFQEHAISSRPEVSWIRIKCRRIETDGRHRTTKRGRVRPFHPSQDAFLLPSFSSARCDGVIRRREGQGGSSRFVVLRGLPTPRVREIASVGPPGAV